MKPELQRRIQRYGWDKAAPYYETGWQRQLRPAQKKLISHADLQKGQSVLDISCGTGLVTLPIAKAVAPVGKVTAIDLSEGMLEKARARANEHKINNISFQQMDAESLDFAENSFDVVVCSLGLMYFPNPQKALQEMFRVLKPGGRASALVWGNRNKCGWADIFPIVDRRVASDVCPLFFQLGGKHALERAFTKAGFGDVISQRFSLMLHFNDEEEACIAAFLGGAVALAYQKFDNQTQREADQEYLASIKQYRNEKGYDVPGEFVVASGFNRSFET